MAGAYHVRRPNQRIAAGPIHATENTEVGETWVGDLVEALSRRYRWHRTRRPTVAAMIGATCGLCRPVCCLGQALLPQHWFCRESHSHTATWPWYWYW